MGGMAGVVPRQVMDTQMLERVEIFKGANSLLNGAASSGVGGMINLEPKRAEDLPTARVGVDYTSDSQVGGTLDLTLTGNTFDVVGTANRITVGADSIDIASNYAGQNTITTLGTVTTGTWNASVIGVPYGGTGAATLTGYVKGNGTAAMTASSTIPNTDITGLGTMSTQAASNVAITGGSITNLTTFDGITIDGGTF